MSSFKRLEWGKCKGDIWCSFQRLILDDDLNSWSGVYIIWSEYIGYRKIEYVGEGIIGSRIAAHRQDARFNSVGDDALVTWAVVPSKWDRLAIEMYLSRTLNPTIGISEAFQATIAVNLPWE